ncbi:helix-turn-helix domain-containing protein [Bradyrhizobium murdochi]|uniref:helix-turn-helix domain-containing protein n=1 Tax=Bradyrhizobium murdochi TaxID=1038859 RepID=UPI00041E85FE|nr:helix-turn-helix domain-containing protein [Bradyrhizobium murdochi]
MRQVREIVRLSLEAGLSTRVVGERVGVGPTTVRDTLKRFACAGLAWPVPEAISDAELEQLLHGVPGVKRRRRTAARRPPD